MARRKPPVPADRSETPRLALLRLLREGPATARDLSRAAGLSEADVLHHLEHLRQSLRRGDERFAVEPAECLSCGFVFAHRSRLGRPGRCPSCHGARITLPRFRVE